MKASEVGDMLKTVGEAVKGLADNQKAIEAKLEKMQEPGYVNKGVPHVRTGEDPLSSRPFLLSRLVAAVADPEVRSEAKYEWDECAKLKKAMGVNGGVWVPLSWALMPDAVKDSNDFIPLKKAMAATAMELAAIDPERFAAETGVPLKKAMSYLDYAAGGSLIAPPEFGELIEPLRNTAVLMQIGATTVPLPPQGSIVMPRMTSDVTPEFFAENPSSGITETDVGTDDLVLTAKGIGGLVRLSNQFLRFSRGVGETVVRNSLNATLALKFDKAGLEGVGSPVTIQGLINTPGISTVVAQVTGADGNTLSARDFARMVMTANEANSDISHWIMRPSTYHGVTEFRADAAAIDDQKGPYLFDLIRALGFNPEKKLRGLPVMVSNQVSKTRTKGSGTALTYVLGVDKQEVMIAMHGAVEIAVANQGDTSFAKNQTLVRATMYGDVGVKRQAGVTFMDTLVQVMS